MRVVSLIPSGTEIVAALGCLPMLVGRSHECDFPEAIRAVPACTSVTFDPHGSSAEIDQRVNETLEKGISLYRVDWQRLTELRPDVIITQAQCDVCAVSQRDVEMAVAAMPTPRPLVVSLQANSLNDVYSDIERVAIALDVAMRGREVVASLRQRMADVSQRANSWGRRPTVACIEWLDPLMMAGNWIPEMIELSGGCSLFAKKGEHSPKVTWEQLVQQDPDVLVVMPCGFDISRTKSEMWILTSKLEWRLLRSVQAGRVWIADGNAYFNRPGPRLAEALEMLAEAIQPAAFSFEHDGLVRYS